ncbi:GABA transporter 1 [Nymphaea thermarum]|nr:GABA transporter 1 [Nymphaea thermarum]
MDVLMHEVVRYCQTVKMSPDDEEAAIVGSFLLKLWRPPSFPSSHDNRHSGGMCPSANGIDIRSFELGECDSGDTVLEHLDCVTVGIEWEKANKLSEACRHRGYWAVAFFQQVASLGNNVALHIAAGSSLKAVYKYYHKNGTLTPQHFIIFFRTFELLLSQLPDIHSLRLVNAVYTFSTFGFAGTTIGVTIHNGTKIDLGSVSYQLQGDTSSKIFRAFNALGTIAFSFGEAMLLEIQLQVLLDILQSSLREPVKINMYRRVLLAYGVTSLSYWQIAFTGFWAFGSGTQPYILASLTTPEWTMLMANVYAVVQIAGCFQIYCGPTYAYFEGKMQYGSICNVPNSCKHLVQFAFTSIYMVLITLFASAMPFFGDFVAICGAVGFTPLDFRFPALFFIKAAKLGCTGATRSIVKDIKTYRTSVP